MCEKSLSIISNIKEALYFEKQKSKDKDKIQNIDRLAYIFNKLNEAIYEISNFCNSPESRLVNEPYLLLLGEAGIGKTHFLCDIAKRQIIQGHPTIILLGQHFQKFTNPGEQIIKLLGLNISFEKFLKKLHHTAIKKKRRCLIIIDAINEGDREIWRKTFNNFIKQIQSFKGVGLVISCRTPFEQAIIPKKPKPNIVTLFHRGFRGIELDAQSIFFKYYKIPMPEVPLLTPEFSNPLFLKLFCKSLERATVKKKHRQIKDIASGQKGMTYIFESFVKEVGKPIEDLFRLRRGYCWNNIFKKIAEKMAEDHRDWISKKELKSLIGIKKANALINKLISEGMLVESLEWTEERERPIEVIRFPYQKFSDHIIARYLLNKFLDTSTKKRIKESLSAYTALGLLFKKEELYRGSGVIEALMLEFPVRIGNKGELLDYVGMDKIPYSLINMFINGLIWREPSAINNSTSKWINRILSCSYFKDKLLDVLVALAVKPKHPYSAKKLNRFLRKMRMNERDLFWTEFLRKQEDYNSIYRIISWIETTKAKTLQREYAKVYITVLMWVLTSTDHLLRDRATRSIYYIGCKFPEILFELTTDSLGINDLYVPERMLAASYGVAMALRYKQSFVSGSLQKYARNLFDLMFRKEAPYSTTHILARDYAKHTIDIALIYNSNLLAEEDKKRITPPFKDGGIRRWGKSEDKNKGEYKNGNYPFGFDFDNYTIGYLLPNRGNYDFKNPEYVKVKSNMWWRIYKLGYSLELFGEIDKEIARHNSYRFGREANGRKIDRYGKKYCWIAWYEIAGLRQDKGLLKRRWEDEPKRFTVDIDPSFPEEVQNIEIIKTSYLGSRTTSLLNWIVRGRTPDITQYLILDSIRGEKGPWILLDGKILQEDLQVERDIFIYPRGFLVKKRELNDIVNYLKKQDLGNRWLPEIPEHLYTFAGEIPWCETFHYYGRVELSFIIKEKIKKYEVIIPVNRLRWSSDASALHFDINSYILSRELCEDLELSGRPQTFDLYDKNNRKASLTLKWGEPGHTFHMLIYIRKDLLDKILYDKELNLIWGIWGERRYKAKEDAKFLEFAEKYPTYKVFQKIITYQSISKERMKSCHMAK